MSTQLAEYPSSTYLPGTEIHCVSVWTCIACGDRYTSRPGDRGIADLMWWRQRMFHAGVPTDGQYRVFTVITSPPRPRMWRYGAL